VRSCGCWYCFAAVQFFVTVPAVLVLFCCCATMCVCYCSCGPGCIPAKLYFGAGPPADNAKKPDIKCYAKQ
jgi:hypothetical protein